MNLSTKTVAIIGAGPAGLIAAQVLAQAGVTVHVYDAMPTAGRKLLLAGKGGLNISHSEAFPQFLSRYGQRAPQLESILKAFPPQAVRAWVEAFGISTFVGSSGRVFPQEMKAAPLLRGCLHVLRQLGVRFFMRHRWLGWTAEQQLRFAIPEGEKCVKADAVLLALGGGSWPHLGSTGSWVSILADVGVSVAALQPANCGFELDWSEYFATRYAGQPLKSVAISVENVWQVGECIVTDYGLEGGLIYNLSASLREQIANNGSVTIYVDLKPDLSLANVQGRLNLSRAKDSWPNFLRKCLAFDAVKAALLREVLSGDDLDNSTILANTIKALPLRLNAARPLAEAISSAGGVCFSGLDQNLMLSNRPGVFCAGEMLDWEAPTGGYLLSACLATGHVAANGVLSWLGQSA